MTQIEYFPKSMNFDVVDVGRNWANYGILQYFGSFEGMPKRYQIVSLQTPKGEQRVVKSWSFIPVPTAVAQTVTHEVAKELNMEIKEESNDGIKYMATLISPQIKGEVEPGDLVAWGIGVRHNVLGNFRIDVSLLRLVCSNGLMRAEDSKNATVEKSYSVEEMKESFLEKAKLLQDTFEQKLELFRQFKQYKVNQQLAQILARTFPAPIIKDVVALGKKKVVQSFVPKNLWEAYNDITYQISHRKLKTSTRFDWSLKATRIFEEFVKEQEAQISS
jgi:hypothetical protein